MAQPTIRQLHKLLIKTQKTVSVAESCTGGFLSSLFTAIPGSSKYFILGAVVYSNKAKEGILKIPSKVIGSKGAVSEEVAKAMADSVRRISEADFSIGITGITGPTGGSSKKPVGTVFIAVDSANRKACKRFHFTGSRSAIRRKAALKALELLNYIITNPSV